MEVAICMYNCIYLFLWQPENIQLLKKKKSNHIYIFMTAILLCEKGFVVFFLQEPGLNIHP